MLHHGCGGRGGGELGPPPVLSTDTYFAEFKVGAGMEIHGQLLENKTSLRQVKALVRRHGLDVNAAKAEIDTLKVALSLEQMSSALMNFHYVTNEIPLYTHQTFAHV